jgi:hypothetical protein
MKGESSLNPHLIVASLLAPIAYIHCCKIVLMFYNALEYENWREKRFVVPSGNLKP